MNNGFKRVTRKESKIARMEFDSIIRQLRQALKLEYKFDIRMNGSARYNCIIRDSNSQYDLDYKLILTRNCRSDYYPNSPTLIKKDFFDEFQIILKNMSIGGVRYNIENSTSVITIIKTINNVRVHSYDVCIIKENVDTKEYEYIGRNSSGNHIDGGNSFTWCKLKEYYEAHEKFKNLNYLEKNELIENYILPIKAKNMVLQNTDPKKKTSETIFIEQVNNYWNRH